MTCYSITLCENTPALIQACGQSDDEGGVVGLDLCLVGGLVADGCAATVTSVYDDVALLGVGLGLHGAENSAAGVCPVAGVDVNVERAKAERAMIARGVAEGQDLFAAVLADEAFILF